TRDGSEKLSQRIDAADALSRFGLEAAGSALRSRLDDESPRLRAASMRLLASLGDVSIVPMLQERATNSTAADERRAAVSALAILGAETTLLDYIRDPDLDVRGAVARGLTDASGLQQLLFDPSDSVRLAAAIRLGALGISSVLHDALNTDDPGVRFAALSGVSPLVQHDTTKAASIAALGVADEVVKNRCFALSIIGDEQLKCRPAVLKCIESDPEDKVRLQAIRALRSMGIADDASVLMARKARVDQSADVHREASQALRDWSIEVTPLEDDIVESINRHHWSALGTYGPDILLFTAHILREVQTDQASVQRRIGACLALGDLSERQKVGAKVLEQLQRIAADQSPSVRAAVARAAGRTGGQAATTLLRRLMTDPTAEVRVGVCKGCDALGGAKAIDILGSLVNDSVEDVRYAAAVALAGPKNGAVDMLAALLKDRNNAMRIKAAGLLAELQDPRAIQPLIDALGDANPTVRYFVRAALSALHWTPIGYKHQADDRGYAFWTNHGQWAQLSGDSEVSMLVSALSDPNPVQRRTAAEGLGDLGDPAAAQALITLLSDVEPDVRRAGAHALRRLDGPTLTPEQLAIQLVETGQTTEAVRQCGASAASALVMVLRERGPAERAAAAWSLGLIPRDADGLEHPILALVNATEDTEAAVREAAADALGRLQAAAGLHALTNLLNDDVLAVRTAAALSLRELGSDGRDALRHGLSHPSEAVREVTAHAIGGLGNDAAYASQELSYRLQNDSAPSVRAAAATALCAAGDPSVASAAAHALLHDSEVSVRSACAKGMHRLHWPIGVAALQSALGDDQAEVREPALDALTAQGLAPDGPALLAVLAVARQDWNAAVACGDPAIPLLERVLADTSRDKDSVIRRAGAISAIARLGGARAETCIVSSLTDIGGFVRAEAARAAGDLKIRSAGPTLVSLLDDPIAPVRRNAAAALACLGFRKGIKRLSQLAESDLDQGVRLAAAEALAVLGEVEILTDQLRHPDLGIRLHAAAKLGTLNDPGAIDPLIGSLGDSNARMRAEALKALLTLGFTPLGERHTVSDDGYIRWVTRSELAQHHGTTKLLQILKNELRSEDAARRRCAVEAAVLGKHHELASALIACLDDPQVDVRRESALALKALGRLPKSGPSRSSALVALGRFDEALELGSIAITPLLRTLAEEHPDYRAQAATALAQCHPNDAISDALCKAASEEAAEVRAAAVLALGTLEIHLAEIIRSLDDTAESVSMAAASVLARPSYDAGVRQQAYANSAFLGRLRLTEALCSAERDTETTELLRQCHQEDDEARVRAAAAAALVPAFTETLLDSVVQDSDSIVRVAAANALATADCQASQDALIRALGDRSINVRRTAIQALRARGIEPTGEHAALQFALAEEHFDTLASFGEAAVPALDAVLKEDGTDLGSVERRVGAIAALATIATPQALDAVAIGLQDYAGPVRIAGARAIGRYADRIGRHKAIAAALRDTLEYDARRDVQVASIIALGRLGDAEAVPLLEARAETAESESVRYAAACALADPSLGQLEYLAAALGSLDTTVRVKAAEALGQTANTEAIDPLIEALGDSVSTVRAAAQDSLSQLGFTAIGVRNDVADEGLRRWRTRSELVERSGKSQWTDLVAFELTQDDPAARRCALEAIALAGDTQLIPTVLTHLDDAHAMVRAEAAHTIRRMHAIPESGQDRARYDLVVGDWDAVRTHGVKLIAELSRALRTRSAGDRVQIAGCLGQLTDKRATAALVEALKNDASPVVRAAAAISLTSHARTAKHLVAALSDTDQSVRFAAATAMAAQGNASIQQLVDRTAADDISVQLAAIHGLATCPIKTREISLVACLSNAHERVRFETLQALHGCNAAEDAICICLTDDASPTVREAAAATLGTLNTTKTEALFAALNDRSPAVRNAALRSIHGLGIQPDAASLKASLALAQEDWVALADLEAHALPAIKSVLSETGTTRFDLTRKLGVLTSLRGIASQLPAGEDATEAVDIVKQALDD
ncbi:MAG: HEAT repeat domain-containing protein, partial [Myxococcota bacterium]|nr:HEAT repeat domain-containing protein [Myxococcota bacterium]